MYAVIISCTGDHAVWHEILAGVTFGGFTIFPRLADYNLADCSGVDALHEHMQYNGNTLAEFNLAVLSCIHQSAKINFSTKISCHTICSFL